MNFYDLPGSNTFPTTKKKEFYNTNQNGVVSNFIIGI